MIFDSMNNFMQYGKLAPAAWEKILKFLADCTEKSPAGRYEIDGDRIYASIQGYETHAPDPDKLEIHRKYVDIQLLLAGKESILCRPVDDLAVTVPKCCACFRKRLLKTRSKFVRKTRLSTSLSRTVA